MIYREYKDFDELFKEFNTELLMNPSLIDTQSGFAGMLKDEVILKAESPNFTFDIGKVAYKNHKFYHLLGKYVNKEDWEKFKTRIATTPGLSLTYRFNPYKFKPNKIATDEGCLISLVFSRKKRKKPLDRVDVFWRTSELPKKFSVDLMLINRLLDDIKEYLDIKSITLILANCYIHSIYCIGLLPWLGLDYDMLDQENFFIKHMIRQKEKYFAPDSEIYTKYDPVRITQTYVFSKGEAYPFVDINDFSIKFKEDE